MQEILYVFDMDDTLVRTPGVYDVIEVRDGKLISGDSAIDGTLKRLLTLSNEVIQDLKNEKDRMKQLAGLENEVYFVKEDGFIYLYRNGKPADLSFIRDIEGSSLISDSEKEQILNKFNLKDDKLILGLFPEFFRTESTIGAELIEKVADVYKNVQNKMIVTGRSEGIRKGAEYILYNVVGLEVPNFGFYLYSGSKGGIQKYKADTVLNSIKKNNWKVIHFFEDRKDWLDFVENEVKREFPDVLFHKHHIII